MKTRNLIVVLGCLTFLSFTGCESGSGGKTITGKDDLTNSIIENVSFRNVIIKDNFWRPKIEINRVTGIRHALQQASNSIENFDIAAGKSNAAHKANMASDSDVYKIIQGAAYALHHTADKELEATIDSVIDRIVAAQQPDGYLFTYWIINDLSQRWIDIDRKHELYCAGHMFEAAAAYYEATGKRKFLDAAMRFADHIDSIFGPNKRLAVPGHEEIELALYQLYKATGQKKYLDLSTFFVDERGDPKRMIVEKITPPDKDPNANTPHRWRPPSYMQDHLPVTQQFYAVGHAVRAGYLYSAMADLAIETKDRKYIPAMDSIWNDIVSKKIYITGGVGTRQFHDEGFGAAFLLPNDQAYCETCSSIALNFWNRRMNLLHADSKYADLLELTMYNAALAGVSLSGDRFFYTNPLESNGNRVRHDWSNPPCCPTNMVRFLPEIGSVIYGKTNNAIYINQFIGSETKIALADKEITLVQKTDYPWDGKVTIEVNPEEQTSFALHIRIPGWAQGELLPGGLYHYLDDVTPLERKMILKVNGEKIPEQDLKMGYAVIDKKWGKGDIVELELPMTVRMIAGNPRIEDARGKVVLMRGPMVYCIEEMDNMQYFADAGNAYLLPGDLEAKKQDDLLNGVVTINGTVSLSGSGKEINISAIPYYAWSNRDQGQMKVWLPFLAND